MVYNESFGVGIHGYFKETYIEDTFSGLLSNRKYTVMYSNCVLLVLQNLVVKCKISSQGQMLLCSKI